MPPESQQPIATPEEAREQEIESSLSKQLEGERNIMRSRGHSQRLGAKLNHGAARFTDRLAGRHKVGGQKSNASKKIKKIAEKRLWQLLFGFIGFNGVIIFLTVVLFYAWVCTANQFGIDTVIAFIKNFGVQLCP